MSILTLEEAISHCLEVAEKNETQADKIGRQLIGTAKDREATDCRECAAEHRQLAEWLTDHEGLRAEIIDLRLYVQMLEEYREKAKRLLKAAVEDITGMQFGNECKVCSKNLLPNECPIHSNASCILEKDFKWRYADETLALIGEDGDTK